MERSFSQQSFGAVQPARELGRTVVKALTDELMGRVAGARRAEVRAQVVAALRDLRGSVSFESIAEMAVRLAEHRLCSMASPDPLQVSVDGRADPASATVTPDQTGNASAVRLSDQPGAAAAETTWNQGTLRRTKHPAIRDDDHEYRPYRRTGHHSTRS
jgi:hypothetical protein